TAGKTTAGKSAVVSGTWWRNRLPADPAGGARAGPSGLTDPGRPVRPGDPVAQGRPGKAVVAGSAPRTDRQTASRPALSVSASIPIRRVVSVSACSTTARQATAVSVSTTIASCAAVSGSVTASGIV